MNKKVVIVLVNWNMYIDTIDCINSLKILTYDNFEILVIDNGSANQSVRTIRDTFPTVNLLSLSKNIGFAGGCNVGINAALAMGADYIFLLNNDTVVIDKVMIEKMVSVMESNNNIGMLSPVILYYNTNRIWFCGGHLDRNTGILKLWDNGKEWHEPVEPKVRNYSFLSGCALFVRADILVRTGGFHDRYFLTSEESELCFKITDMGYEISVVEGCILYHKVSMSMGVETPLQIYFLYRNKLLFIKRNAKEIKLHDLLKIFNYYLSRVIIYIVKGKPTLSAAILLGVRDFLLGRDGLGHYEGRL